MTASRRDMLRWAIAVPAFIATGARAEDAARVIVFRDPGCGCCHTWVTHLEANGFAVTVHDTADMTAVKARLGVPPEVASCHTAEVGGYVIEGHVPAVAIRRLLAEKPQGRGLAVPGMPAGSPGMEGGVPVIYEVLLFGAGVPTRFGRFREDKAV